MAAPTLIAQAIERLTEVSLGEARLQLQHRRSNAFYTWGLFYLFAVAGGAIFGALVAEGPMAGVVLPIAAAGAAFVAFLWSRARRERTVIAQRLNDALDSIGAARAMALSSNIEKATVEPVRWSLRAVLDARDSGAFARLPATLLRIDDEQTPP